MLTEVERQILFNQKLIVLMLQCPEAIHSEIAQMAIKIAMDRTDTLLTEDETDAKTL